MASSDARPLPKKNVAYRHYFAIRKNDGSLITSWSGADTELSADGAAFSDATNEATEIGTSGIGYIDLTSGEMNTDATVMKVTVTNTDALPYVVTFFPEEGGDVRVDVTQFGGTNGTFSGGRPEVNATHWGGTAVGSALVRGNVIQWTGTNVATPDTAGYPKVTIKSGNGTGELSLSSGAVLADVQSIAEGAIASDSFSAGALNAAAVNADVVTAIQSGLATAANLATVAGYIDTEIAAIKAKTDNLPTDPADASDIAASFVKVRKYLQLLARKDAAIATDNATELGELNADGGSGAGSFDNTTDSLEAQKDNPPSATVDQQDVRDAMKLAPSAGDPDDGSIDDLLAGLSPATPANESIEISEEDITIDED